MLIPNLEGYRVALIGAIGIFAPMAMALSDILTNVQLFGYASAFHQLGIGAVAQGSAAVAPIEAASGMGQVLAQLGVPGVVIYLVVQLYNREREERLRAQRELSDLEKTVRTEIVTSLERAIKDLKDHSGDRAANP
jgi:hypothetical protein